MTAEFTVAVHALVFLNHHSGDVISSGKLAENICTNPARVRKVMAQLHKAGLVEALQGKGSGYRAKPGTAALPLAKVLAALDEDPVTMGWRSGALDKDCMISSGMGAVMENLYADLNTVCRSRLAAVTIGTLENEIFGGGETEGKTL